eukprot:Opistho-1_new@55005
MLLAVALLMGSAAWLAKDTSAWQQWRADYGMNRFRVLANMAQSPQEGRNLFAKLTKVTDRFLDVALQYVGAVPYDESVRKAVQKQRAVYEAFPRSKCALAFKATHVLC